LVYKRDFILKLLQENKVPENVIEHVICVEKLCLKIASFIDENKINTNILSAGALLHDIGRSVTHSMQHAIEGAKLIKKINFPEEIIHIVENHIGAGITKDEAIELGLPEKDYIPLSLEAKIVAASDNLISGTTKVPINYLYNNLIKKNAVNAAQRVLDLHNELSTLIGINLDEL